MGLKQKLSMGVMSATLGLALVGGGTYAYFSDSAKTNNTFATGTLQMNLNTPDPHHAIVNLDNLKPGDTVKRAFSLTNDGTLDFKDVMLATKYTVHDAHKNNSEDFGKYIRVNFYLNTTSGDRLIESKTLNELADMDPIDVLGGKGLPASNKNYQNFYAEFEFVDNGEDQNEFQGDSVNLDWTFTAHQTEGTEYSQ